MISFEDARGAWLLMLACSHEMQSSNRQMHDIEIEQQYKDAAQILNEYFVGKKIEETMKDGQ